MAAKKTASKSTKKTAATKSTKKAAKAVTKKAAAKPAAKSATKSAPRKAAPKQASDKAAAPKAAAAAPKPSPAKAKGGISSKAVNLGHVLALRPRVSASFKADSLREARQLLEEEGYASLEEAARAVAEKALELTRDGAKGRSGRGRR